MKRIDRMKVARHLAECGFDPGVAGDTDFNMAVEGISTAMEEERGIFVSGIPGCGKSKLCNIAAPMLLKDGLVTFVMGIKEQGINFIKDEAILTRAYESGALIDDLGADQPEYGHDYGLELIYAMLWHGECYPGRGNIVCSTNHDFDEMVARYGERIPSRIAARCVSWRMTGGDKRQLINLKDGAVFKRGAVTKKINVNYAKEVEARERDEG